MKISSIVRLGLAATTLLNASPARASGSLAARTPGLSKHLPSTQIFDSNRKIEKLRSPKSLVLASHAQQFTKGNEASNIEIPPHILSLQEGNADAAATQNIWSALEAQRTSQGLTFAAPIELIMSSAHKQKQQEVTNSFMKISQFA